MGRKTKSFLTFLVFICKKCVYQLPAMWKWFITSGPKEDNVDDDILKPDLLRSEETISMKKSAYWTKTREEVERNQPKSSSTLGEIITKISDFSTERDGIISFYCCNIFVTGYINLTWRCRNGIWKPLMSHHPGTKVSLSDPSDPAGLQTDERVWLFLIV